MASEIRLTDSAARLFLQHQDITYLAGLCPAAKGICSPEHSTTLTCSRGTAMNHLLRAKPSAGGFSVPPSVNSQNNLVPSPVLQMKRQTSKL